METSSVETRLLISRIDDDNQVSQEEIIMSSDGKRVIHKVDFFAEKTCSKEQSSIEMKKKECFHRSEMDVNLQVVEAKLERMRLENQKLRGMLNQVNSNYNSLQIYVATLMQHQQIRKAETLEMIDKPLGEKKYMVERQFMDLGHAAPLAMDKEKYESSQDSLKGGSRDSSRRSPEKIIEVGNLECELQRNRSCNKTIPLFNENKSGCKDNGRSGRKAKSSEEEFQGRFHSKVPKLSTSRDVDQDIENMPKMSKARVSVRAISEAFMISDGCQWRKYGQKTAKGNPCPRAYYRCSMSTSCPVRKQIQRCAEDETILTTSYEGLHNHPLPQAAIAMASTTSAAASMLLSGSMPSADYHGQGTMMNSNNFLARTIIPGMPTSFATISGSAIFPTITLDLTHKSQCS